MDIYIILMIKRVSRRDPSPLLSGMSGMCPPLRPGHGGLDAKADGAVDVPVLPLEVWGAHTYPLRLRSPTCGYGFHAQGSGLRVMEMKFWESVYLGLLIIMSFVVGALVITGGDPALIAFDSALVGWGFAFLVFGDDG